MPDAPVMCRPNAPSSWLPPEPSDAANRAEPCEALARLPRRHVVIVVRRQRNHLEQFALIRQAGNNGPVTRLQFLQRVFFNIQAQPGLSLILIRPVAGITILGKNWPDIAIKI